MHSYILKAKIAYSQKNPLKSLKSQILHEQPDGGMLPELLLTAVNQSFQQHTTGSISKKAFAFSPSPAFLPPLAGTEK